MYTCHNSYGDLNSPLPAGTVWR